MKRFVRLFISLLYLCLSKPFVLFRNLLKHNRTLYCTILYYHSVPKYGLRKFIAQLNILKKFTKIVHLGEYQGLSKGKKYSIITFDDAFQSTVDNAIPELIKRDIPFTLFVPAGKMGIRPDWKCHKGGIEDRVARTDDLLQLPDDLATFGSHTVNHASLIEMGEVEAMREVQESKDILESLLKRKIEYIAFPYGDYSENILRLCRKAGYLQTFTTNYESPLSPLSTYDKGRIKVEISTWHLELILFVVGAYDWIKSYTKMKLIIKRFSRKLAKIRKRMG